MKRQTRPHPGRRLPSTVAGARVSHPTALFPWRARGRRVVRPCRGEILARTGLLLAIILAGCAPVPRFGPPPTVGPPYFPPPEPVWVVLDPKLYGYADSTAVGSTHRPTEARPARARAGRTGPDEDPIASRGTDVVDSPGASPGRATIPEPIPEVTPRLAPGIAIDLPPADVVRLERAARRNLAAADSLVRIADRRSATGTRRDKAETAVGLMAQAREALARGDARAAANLAYKARLLAAEAGR